MIEIIKLFLIFLKVHLENKDKIKNEEKELDKLYEENFKKSLSILRKTEETSSSENEIDKLY